MINMKLLPVTILLLTLNKASVCADVFRKDFTEKLGDLKWSIGQQRKHRLTAAKLAGSQELNYRLPRNAFPVTYELFITPYFVRNEENVFLGKTIIKIRIVEDTPTITLHADQLEIQKITLPHNSVIGTSYNALAKQYTITFQHILRANQEIKLKFEYIGKFSLRLVGFYKSAYLNDKGKKRYFATTKFEPIYARRAFPCFDEPSLKATFKVNLAVPKNYSSLSNVGSNPEKVPHLTLKDREWHKYKESKKMSTYLLAFVISDFESVREANSRVTVWAKHELAQYCKYASKAGNASLNYLEELFQYKYDLNEMNFVAIPNFKHGAMENWGLVTFKEGALAYYDGIAAQEKYDVVTIIAHELVHQWFGNLVTLDWWEYTWLNEGFAEYFSYVIADKVEPNYHLPEIFVSFSLGKALDLDGEELSHSVNNQLLNANGVEGVFDNIAYQKAASVIRMFHKSFGDDAFYAVMRTYIKNNAFKNVRPDQLIAEFQQYFDSINSAILGYPEVSVTTIMNSWLDQPGYPIVILTRKNHSINFKQKRFLKTPAANSSAADVKYWIPVNFTTNTENSFVSVSPRFWLGPKGRTFQVDLDYKWYLVNIGYAGYYRVNYDNDNWKALSDVLNSDDYVTIPVLNRAQLVSDALNLAQAGEIRYDIAFNILKYLSQETSFYPWYEFFRSTYDMSLRINGDLELKVLYKKFILTLIPKVYNSVGFKINSANDSNLVQLTRHMILTAACKYGYEDCVNQSRIYFETGSNPQDEIYPIAQCAYIRSEPVEELLKNNLSIINLNCAQNPTIVKKNLYDIINRKTYQPTSLVSYFNLLKMDAPSLEIAMQFLENEMDTVYKYFGDWNSVGYIFSKIANFISSKSQIDILARLANNEKLIKIKPYVDSTIRKATKSYEWFEKYEGTIRNWLVKYNNEKRL